ncbi:coiled-coil domain-containing protein 172 isoform X1 [Oryzias melastigma]|uniref:coiled-coil domain-containing protein 172 isoform X1 n=1 Tax=Oryzias melastigma TaxID=30732 RepID=UPI000CF802D0|nr:coiled-coil domain-containing protein 172 isoform X1 [Oryzias melastigma]
MSLDSLFQQVLLTEQQQSEQIQKLKDVKVSIIKCNEKIKNATEKYENIKEELNKKAPRLCILRLQCDLMRKTEDLMLKHIEELSCQRNHLGESLAKIRRESKEEEEHFLQEISGFNRDFSLQGNKVTLLESQTRSELQLLQREEEALHKEMEAMTAENDHMRAAAEEKNALLLDLEVVKNTERVSAWLLILPPFAFPPSAVSSFSDLDGRLKEAKLTTESLKLESQFVSQKHLTDSTCVRLRKELEMYKEEELEQLNLKDALNSEIQFCQSRLDQLE